MSEMTQDVQTNNFGPWTSAGVYDNSVKEFLKKRVLKENNSIFFFDLFCLVVSIASLFASFLFTSIYVTIIAAVIAGVFVYLVTENNRERVLILRLLDEKKYQICEVDVFEFAPNRSKKKYCLVKDKQGNVFIDEKKTDEPKQVLYYWYFSEKETAGILVRMPKGTKGMYYVVLPVSYLVIEK